MSYKWRIGSDFSAQARVSFRRIDFRCFEFIGKILVAIKQSWAILNRCWGCGCSGSRCATEWGRPSVVEGGWTVIPHG